MIKEQQLSERLNADRYGPFLKSLIFADREKKSEHHEKKMTRFLRGNLQTKMKVIEKSDLLVNTDGVCFYRFNIQ